MLLRLGRRPPWLGPCFRWAMHLDQWAMPDVFLIGAAVGYSRVMAKMHAEIGSVSRETAAAVGTRHGRLALLEVRAGEMHRAGIIFYKTPNNVWLTDFIPQEYLVFP